MTEMVNQIQNVNDYYDVNRDDFLVWIRAYTHLILYAIWHIVSMLLRQHILAEQNRYLYTLLVYSRLTFQNQLMIIVLYVYLWLHRDLKNKNLLSVNKS